MDGAIAVMDQQAPGGPSCDADKAIHHTIPQHNMKAQIMSSTVFAVSFDAHDAQTIASFWAAVLGRTVADGANGDNAAISADPDIPGSRISFHRVPEGKTVKNRMHFDLITTDFDAEVGRLTSLGATRLNEINAAATGATLADPRATNSTSSPARRARPRTCRRRRCCAAGGAPPPAGRGILDRR